ncbi:MAG: AraC family transcriptional regulator [Verrucomicrobiaceae bacterium]|nr:MAG: AraC family transcriptional regulator [Verrucomicrobiaceae bacterium]
MISKIQLIELHIRDQVPVGEIAATYRMSARTVRRIITEAGHSVIYYRSRRRRAWKDILTYQFLYENYVSQGKSAAQIARELGCAHGNVTKWLRVAGIPIRAGEFRAHSMHNHCGWKGIGTMPSSALTRIKNNAKVRGIECTVDLPFLWSLFELQDGKCALSGRIISFQPTLKCSASLDRKDSSIGYIEGNVWWVHKDVNLAKQSLSIADFILLCQDVAQQNK